MGRNTVAVIDPGPDDGDHLAVIAEEVSDATRVLILLTHHHTDHSGGARSLANMLDAQIWAPEGSGQLDRELSGGDLISTDHGPLTSVPTPGHAERHLAYHWPSQRAVFVGDLLLGEGRTTWVGGYPGCVADYLGSLSRIRGLGAAVLYPAHGPPLVNASAAISRFEDHRRSRIDDVRRALQEVPDATTDAVMNRVYGNSLPPGAEKAVKASISALLEHVRRESAVGDLGAQASTLRYRGIPLRRHGEGPTTCI